VAGRIVSMKTFIDIIGNRSRDLPVCSAVPQPLRHRVPPLYFIRTYKCVTGSDGLQSCYHVEINIMLYEYNLLQLHSKSVKINYLNRFFIMMFIPCIIKRTENNQPNAMNLIFLFIPYNGSYMFRQLYAIIREHLCTF
jgi:hypothetical protein